MIDLPSTDAREPGTTNLQHSLAQFVWMAEREYLYPLADGASRAARVGEPLRLQLIERIDRLYNLIENSPRWADFTPLQRANISAQTGGWIRWFLSGPDFTQDTVLIEDPATNDQWGYCADPENENPDTLQIPCEVFYQSDCYTITRTETRGIQAQNWSRLFGCPDYFYQLEAAVDQVTESLGAVDAELGLNQLGEVSVAEVGEAVLDEVITTKLAMTDQEFTETPPIWIGLAIAGVVGFFVFRGINA